jgi:hypothetical protein
MPLLAVNTHDPRTDVIDLDDFIPPREIAIAWHTDRGMTAPVEEFADLVVEIGSAIHDQALRNPADESALAFSGKHTFTAVSRS